MTAILDKAGDVLGTLAPTVATALGGPFAGMAVRKLAEKLGFDPSNTDDTTIGDFILHNQDPQTFAEIKKAELEFERDLKELDIAREELDVQRDRIAAEDRASARQRQAETGDWTPAALAGVIVIGFFIAMIALFRLAIPSENANVLYVLIGGLAALMTQVGNFYFGSSRGSKHKDAALGGAVRDLQAALSSKVAAAPQSGFVSAPPREN